MTQPRNLGDEWIHLGLGATAEIQPPFSGLAWYGDYSERHARDGSEGRLVSMFSFCADWDSWEMHPSGAEVVICTSGRLVLIQDIDWRHERIALEPGQYAINPPNVWHTADVPVAADAIFITAGMGTEHRSR